MGTGSVLETIQSPHGWVFASPLHPEAASFHSNFKHGRNPPTRNNLTSYFHPGAVGFGHGSFSEV